MIVEFVQFTYPPGLDPRTNTRGCAHERSALARATRSLSASTISSGEDGTGGAFYIWPSKEAAQRGHNAEWFANIKARTGSVPTIRYFDLTMIVDNEAGPVTRIPAEC